jgi:hypothetical protein
MNADGYTVMRDGITARGSTGAAADVLLDRLMAIRFGRDICGDLAAAERREWWVGNGRGAYAAGTLALTLTRRYHGLLIAPVDPPLARKPMPSYSSEKSVSRFTPIVGQAERLRRKAISRSRAFISTARFRYGVLP